MSIEKLKEPSSWAGIGLLLTAFGVNIPDAVTQPAISILTGIAGLAAFFLSERK